MINLHNCFTTNGNADPTVNAESFASIAIDGDDWLFTLCHAFKGYWNWWADGSCALKETISVSWQSSSESRTSERLDRVMSDIEIRSSSILMEVEDIDDSEFGGNMPRGAIALLIAGRNSAADINIRWIGNPQAFLCNEREIQAHTVPHTMRAQYKNTANGGSLPNVATRFMSSSGMQGSFEATQWRPLPNSYIIVSDNYVDISAFSAWLAKCPADLAVPLELATFTQLGDAKTALTCILTL